MATRKTTGCQAKKCPPPGTKATSLQDLEKLIENEWRGPCSDTGKRAEKIFKIALPYLRTWGSHWRYALTWAEHWLPALVQDRGESWVEQAWSRLPRRPKLPGTDPIAKLFGVTAELRQALGLLSTFEVSRPKAVRREEALERKAEKERDRRAGLRPEVRPLKAPSISQMEPWEAEGIKRSTWYARRKVKAEALAAQRTAVTQRDAPTISTVLKSKVAPILVKRASSSTTTERAQQAVQGSRKLPEAPLGSSVRQQANYLERLPF